MLTPATRVLTVRGDRALLRDGAPVEVAFGELPESGTRDAVLLGDAGGLRFAARAIASEAEAERLESATGGRFESLRSMAAVLPPLQTALLFHGAALLAWHARSRFCGSCGAPTRPARAGQQRVCTAESCAETQFPRTDPAIITLIRRDDQALLLHQPRWPPGRFSTLAGFVEPGETLEGAVAREVGEEVGLGVARTEYVGSQPWPFPHTLMIGFRTWAEPGGVVLGEEVAEARWFTRPELKEALGRQELSIPAPFSLSRSLIEEWLGETPA